jgi:hypothetical protein
MTWWEILKGVKGKQFKLFKEAILEWSEEQDVGTSVIIEEIVEDLRGRYYDKIVAGGMPASAAGSHARAKLEISRAGQLIGKILRGAGWNNVIRRAGDIKTRVWTKE